MHLSVIFVLALMCRAFSTSFVETNTKLNKDVIKNDFKNFYVTESVSGRDLDFNRKDQSHFDFKDFYKKEDFQCQSQSEKYDKLKKAIDNYIQRYVSLFLISSKLQGYKVQGTNEIIYADLEFYITSEDLAFLQEYSKSKPDSSLYRDLAKLDEIFGKSIKIKEKDLLKKTMKSAKGFSFDLDPEIYQFIETNYVYFLLFLLIVGVNWFFYNVPLKKFALIVIIVNSLILWEGFLNYWKKVKESDLENYVKLKQYPEAPADCDFENQNWYQRLSDLIFGNKCLQYYKALNQNSLDEVSLLDNILTTYGFYLVRTPLKILGVSMKDFAGEITNRLPFPFNILVYIPISIIAMIVFVVVLLVLCGSRLRLSYLGCGLEVANHPSIIASTSRHILPGPELFKRQDLAQRRRKIKGVISSKYPRRPEEISTTLKLKKPLQIMIKAEESNLGNGSRIITARPFFRQRGGLF